MYSLVSAPVLGFDLTRLDGGSATAEVLLRALCLTEDQLPVLAGHLPVDWARAQLWLDVEDASARVPSIKSIGGTDLADDPERVLAIVERAPVGTLDGLLRCLRYDVMSWTWSGTGTAARQRPTAEAATALLCDAAVAAYLKDHLSARTRRQLSAGWVSALRELPGPAPIELGPHHLAATALLDRLRTLRPEDARRLSQAADDARSHQAAGWTAAAHSACWAAHLSDRIRTAAAGQLLLVQALDNGVITVAERAGGVWNLLSGSLQALIVRDLLDTTTTHRLLAPVIAVLGPAWLA